MYIKNKGVILHHQTLIIKTMKRFFSILFWISALCLILTGDYEEQPFYALFGSIMLLSGVCYMHSDIIEDFFTKY